MNKTAIKNFSIWARNKLIADIQYKAGLMGITADGIKQPLPQSTRETEFYDIGTTEPYAITGESIRQRKSLVEAIERKEKETNYQTAYKYIIEGVAYTWFNRLIAIRFMEVNDYLPSHVRVLSSETGKMEPDLVTAPFDSEISFSDVEKQEIIQLKNENNLDECFRLLYIKQCNALNEILPSLFEKTADYTELLLSISVIDKEGVVYHLVNDIPEDDFNIEKGGQVEIIGWLYQYYNTEPKNEAFAKSGKITKDEIPAVTQLFTPDWIVRYMVENSLGRLWVEGHPNELLKEKWKYYLEEAEQEPEVQEKLDEIHTEYANLNPEDIHFIDPCMGSGHILVYAFDVFMQIYTAAGYSERDAARSILENNLYGLDIDDRAYQMAYFAVMMKARQYNRRILSSETPCHVYSIQESNSINRNQLKYFGSSLNEMEKNDALNQIEGLLDIFKDAKEYGSILNVENYNWDLLRRFANDADVDGQMTLDAVGLPQAQEKIKLFIDIGDTMARKYEVVVTNPPYLSEMNNTLQKYLKKNHSNSKNDLCTVFIECCLRMTTRNAYLSMITQNAFMFLSRYEKFRIAFLSNTIINMIHLGSRAFDEIGGEVVQTTTFVIQNQKCKQYRTTYKRLTEYKSECEKEKAYHNEKSYVCSNIRFDEIPGMPMTYWVSENAIKMFDNDSLDQHADPRVGMFTTDNNRFLREWWEPLLSDVGFGFCNKEDAYASEYKWFPYNKGGGYRRWYGMIDLVVYWYHGGEEIKKIVIDKYPYLKGNYDFVLKTSNPYCEAGITWSGLTSGANSFRICGNGFFFDTNKGAMLFKKDIELTYLLALLNSKVSQLAINILNSTISLQIGDVASIPIVYNKEKAGYINCVSEKCVEICRSDWDAHETSWDFKRHPLLPPKKQVDNDQDSSSMCGLDESASKDTLSKYSDQFTDDELHFAVFCIESIAERLNVDSAIVYDALSKNSDILQQYIVPCYETLHSQDKEYIVDEILEVMKERGVKI